MGPLLLELRSLNVADGYDIITMGGKSHKPPGFQRSSVVKERSPSPGVWGRVFFSHRVSGDTMTSGARTDKQPLPTDEQKLKTDVIKDMGFTPTILPTDGQNVKTITTDGESS